MKPIKFFVAFCIAVLIIPQQAAAQSFPAPAGEIFRQEGIASWYGPEFDGRPTASGEIFNSSLLTAAHPTLPFGTILLVTNRQNNRQVAVKVNDRGPFVANRIVDVSRAAAEQLDMLVTGIAPVLIEAIGTPHVEIPVQQDPFAFAQPVPQPPVVIQQAPQPQFFTQPAPQAQFFTQPPAPQQPMFTQPTPQPQFFTPPPAQVVPQPMPQQAPQAIPQPLPQAAPQMAQQVTPETPAAVPYMPITVTVFPPVQAPQQMPAIPTVNVVPQQQITPVPEIQPPPQIPTGARLIPAITPIPGRIYRLQVGSFRIASNAVESYVRLQRTGLSPEYERFDDLYRVVLRGVRGEDVQSTAIKIEEAGFNEAMIREE
jgi:rare lipoprotein A